MKQQIRSRISGLRDLLQNHTLEYLSSSEIVRQTVSRECHIQIWDETYTPIKSVKIWI